MSSFLTRTYLLELLLSHSPYHCQVLQSALDTDNRLRPIQEIIIRTYVLALSQVQRSPFFHGMPDFVDAYFALLDENEIVIDFSHL